MCACKQRQHNSKLIDDDDYADLKRIVISEAKKTFEATEAAKRRRTLDPASEFSTPPSKAGVPSCSDSSLAFGSSPATPELRERVAAFFSPATGLLLLLSEGHAFIRRACLYLKGMLVSEGLCL